MKDPFRTIGDYEIFLYSLKERFPSIKHSTLTLVKRGVSLARVSGEVHFDHGFRLVMRERILFHRLPVVIDEYGYEIPTLTISTFNPISRAIEFLRPIAASPVRIYPYS